MKMILLNNYNKLGISLADNAKEMLLNMKSDDYGVIYGHYCKISKKWYCGQTVMVNNPYDRWGYNGKNYTSGKFSNAIQKYGWENFEHTIFGFYEKELLSDMEKFWIEQKDSYDNGYNSTEGGSLVDMSGKHHSELSKRRIGLSNGRKIVRFKKKSRYR